MYIPRFEAPSYTDKHWIQKSYGGYNPCIHISGGSVLPNCVGYAWGRFMEILGETPTCVTSDGGKWFASTQDGYSRGQVPKLGAVMCEELPGSWGHVSIVEEIFADGSYKTSGSSYQGKRFRVETVQPGKGTWSNYRLQGFIYNPAVTGGGVANKQDEFIQAAKSKVGNKGTETWSSLGTAQGSAWNHAFILSIAKEVNVLSTLIPKASSPRELARLGVMFGLGTFIKGPYWGESPSPEAGDIVLFRHSLIPSIDTYGATKSGIVYSVNNKQITVIEGDSGNGDNNKSTVRRVEYARTNKQIGGYYRPNWSKVRGSIDGITTQVGSLYTTENTREDATIREVGYINSAGKPSITTSDIKLSTLNYTTILGKMFQTIGADYATSSNTSTSDVGNLASVPREIAEFLLGKGLNTAAVCGILANIEAECNFKVGAVNSIGASGMCQWLYGRKTAMINMAGNNWASNLTGQCEYLWHELNSGYKSNVLVPLTQVPNTLDGAFQACNIFLHKFEIPCTHGSGNPVSVTCSYYITRKAYAEKHWKSIIQRL